MGNKAVYHVIILSFINPSTDLSHLLMQTLLFYILHQTYYFAPATITTRVNLATGCNKLLAQMTRGVYHANMQWWGGWRVTHLGRELMTKRTTSAVTTRGEVRNGRVPWGNTDLYFCWFSINFKDYIQNWCEPFSNLKILNIMKGLDLFIVVLPLVWKVSLYLFNGHLTISASIRSLRAALNKMFLPYKFSCVAFVEQRLCLCFWVSKHTAIHTNTHNLHLFYFLLSDKKNELFYRWAKEWLHHVHISDWLIASLSMCAEQGIRYMLFPISARHSLESRK